MNEQALKERIKYIAQPEGRVFNQVWRILILERLLVRLSHSPYSEQFIFKGGLLLSYYITLGRETKDDDFTTRKQNINASQNHFRRAFAFRMKRILQSNLSGQYIYPFFNMIQILKLSDPTGWNKADRN